MLLLFLDINDGGDLDQIYYFYSMSLHFLLHHVLVMLVLCFDYDLVMSFLS